MFHVYLIQAQVAALYFLNSPCCKIQPNSDPTAAQLQTSYDIFNFLVSAFMTCEWIPPYSSNLSYFLYYYNLLYSITGLFSPSIILCLLLEKLNSSVVAGW